MNRFIMRIGAPPKAPQPAKPKRAPRKPHWIDWVPKLIAVILLGVAALGVRGWFG